MDPSIIEKDIRTMVGGHFTADALGEQVYDAIMSRARSSPQGYIAMFKSLFLEQAIAPAKYAALHLPSFLHFMALSAPDEVRVIADQMVARYDTMLADLGDVRAPETASVAARRDAPPLMRRLLERRKQLQALR